jgi:hypothetical protein
MICLGRKCCFQEISYAGNPEVASSYIISNLWFPLKTFADVFFSEDRFPDQLKTAKKINRSKLLLLKKVQKVFAAQEKKILIQKLII